MMIITGYSPLPSTGYTSPESATFQSESNILLADDGIDTLLNSGPLLEFRYDIGS